MQGYYIELEKGFVRWQVWVMNDKASVAIFRRRKKDRPCWMGIGHEMTKKERIGDFPHLAVRVRCGMRLREISNTETATWNQRQQYSNDEMKVMFRVFPQLLIEAGFPTIRTHGTPQIVAIQLALEK